MKRRTVLGLFAGASGLSALSFGSGAFSFTRAERDLTVEVKKDNDAYLGLQQLGDGLDGLSEGERSRESGTPDTVRFRFPSHDEQDQNGDLGLGSDSTYRFIYDAGEGPDGVAGLLKITNQGTNSIEVRTEQPETDGPSVGLFPVNADGEPLNSDGSPTDLKTVKTLSEREDNEPLGVGEALRVGFEIDTSGVADVDRYDEILEITGSATSE
ncbi:hypothetical protein [Natrialba hulunbeirensis]|uniref:hypothetical protein n=1 Tax=Natrialba hulunbeirensis TaxID=123783 RepID=UPI0012689960|nr:hypothetical protein [Natrialba hulunbeirensis]